LNLTGKITNIIDQYKVIINIGTNKNVNIGTKFKIIAKRLEIRDPDTKELLGSTVIEKGRVRVTEVFEKFCIAETYGKIIQPNPPLFTFNREVDKPLKTSGEEVSFDVRIGDEVVEIADSPPAVFFG
jgi:hypothetical protein